MQQIGFLGCGNMGGAILEGALQSGQLEAAQVILFDISAAAMQRMAALGVRLAGDASYFGKIVKKPYIGDDVRPVEISDIRRANRLLYVTAFLCEALLLMLLIVAYAVVAGCW